MRLNHTIGQTASGVRITAVTCFSLGSCALQAPDALCSHTRKYQEEVFSLYRHKKWCIQNEFHFKKSSIFTLTSFPWYHLCHCWGSLVVSAYFPLFCAPHLPGFLEILCPAVFHIPNTPRLCHRLWVHCAQSQWPQLKKWKRDTVWSSTGAKIAVTYQSHPQPEPNLSNQ